VATRTIPVAGNGTGSLSYLIQGPDVLDIEAVLAVIDTGGAGDTTATLTVTSPAGNDVAAVPQGQAVSGGGAGRATWALRLAEDVGGATPGVDQYEAIRTDPGPLIAPGVFTLLPWVKDFGDDLLANIGTTAPVIVTAGTYAITVLARGGVAALPYQIGAQWRVPRLGASFQAFTTSADANTGLVASVGPIMSVTKPLVAGDIIDIGVAHNSAGNVRIGLVAGVALLA
jgi:hypothetical protein